MADAGLNVTRLVRAARDRSGGLQAQHVAFTELVRRFEEMAFITALRMSNGPDQARDACQEAFLTAWRGLPTLKEPAAFGAWLKTLVRTHCARARRRKDTVELKDVVDRGPDPVDVIAHREIQDTLWRVVTALPLKERQAIVMFYGLGASLRDVAHAHRTTSALAAKRVYNARLKLRRTLPTRVARAFLRTRPTTVFTRAVRAGVFDEFTGVYRFVERPTLLVVIRREGDELASYANGQRDVLAGGDQGVLVTTAFDGQGRFSRDRRGRIASFIYYEFGRRVGTARRMS